MVRRISTRIKRRLGLATTFNCTRFIKPGIRKNRPRTFKNEEQAHEYASKMGLKKEEYFLKKVKKDKKFQIVKMKK